MRSFCKKCHHPCHCGEEKELHADEYGVCTCEGCECKPDKEEEYWRLVSCTIIIQAY